MLNQNRLSAPQPPPGLEATKPPELIPLHSAADLVRSIEDGPTDSAPLSGTENGSWPSAPASASCACATDKGLAAARLAKADSCSSCRRMSAVISIDPTQTRFCASTATTWARIRSCSGVQESALT